MQSSKTNLKLIYEGSVKQVWQGPEKDKLYFEYTDDYSVFDWGKMPDTIANKGMALTALGAFFFEELAKKDFWAKLPNSPHLKTLDQAWLKKRFEHKVFADLKKTGGQSHYQKLVLNNGKAISYSKIAEQKDPVYMEVLKAVVDRPEPHSVLGQTAYFYKQSNTTPRLIPLEVVFRFGMPQGSGLISRLEKNPEYINVLGLTKMPEVGKFFEHPVIEFYTKLEPKDRLLTIQEAALMAGLNGHELEALSELAYDLALALYVIFAESGIELWDGKFEFLQGDKEILLADSIGPDELRLLYKGYHLSKEMIRQVYRGSVWEKAIKEAQEMAKFKGLSDWKEICIEELKAKPDHLPARFKLLIDKLYGSLTNHLIGEEVFENQPSLDQFVEAIPAANGVSV